MILSDGAIRKLLEKGAIIIEPLEVGNIQPASIDVRLGNTFLIFNRCACSVIDPRDPLSVPMHKIEVGGRGEEGEEEEDFILHPGEFALGCTLERLELPLDIASRIEGKSSLGRLGLLVHATAGFIDPGWVGRLTLELSNVAPLPIRLWPGMKIAQLSFMQMNAPCERGYGHPLLNSKYQGQLEPVASRFDPSY